MTQIQLEYWKHKENQRHNIQSEYLTQSDIGEKVRHNKVQEFVSQQDVNERVRHNKNQESIDRTYNANKLAIDRYNAYTSRQDADTRLKEYGIHAALAKANVNKIKAETEGQRISNWHSNRSKDIRSKYSLAEEINYTMQPVSTMGSALLGKGGVLGAWTYTGGK